MDTILTLLKVETMETMEWMETYLFTSRVPKPTELKVCPEVSIVSTFAIVASIFVFGGASPYHYCPSLIAGAALFWKGILAFLN